MQSDGKGNGLDLHATMFSDPTCPTKTMNLKCDMIKPNELEVSNNMLLVLGFVFFFYIVTVVIETNGYSYVTGVKK